jgi:hypothetical protein
MDPDTKKAMGTNVNKPLNMPEALFMEEDTAGSPIAVKLKRRHIIVAIEDFWRIDDEWWRTKPVSRMYYAVILESGRRMIPCKDLINKCWYQQSY